MNRSILQENQNSRKEIPLWRLLCFVMFCVWQMGIIYYVGPALNIDGRTPLPISADNLTLLIVAGYILSIFTMVIRPNTVIRLCQISTMISLFSAVGLFFPLNASVLTILIYIQCFCCCYMIGFESATMVHYFSQNSVIRHLLIAYPIGYSLIALIQNDWFVIDFSVFRILTVIMLGLLLIFYINMPSGACVRFVQKSDNIVLPKKFLYGFVLLAFLSALLGVIAPAAAAEVKHGVFITYISCSLCSVGLYLLYKKTGKHPIGFIRYVIALSAIGYVILVVSEHIPAMGIIAASLIGVGMSSCALVPLFGLLLFKQYPSKLIVPGYIALCMLAVIVQSALVEVFRNSPVFLNLAYLIVVIILAIIYVLVEPYFLFSVQKEFDEFTPEGASSTDVSEKIPLATSLLQVLTKRESEVVDLITMGYSNSDIAKTLCISEYTVKDHTKNIYRKLDVHSRFELTALVTRLKDSDKNK